MYVFMSGQMKGNLVYISNDYKQRIPSVDKIPLSKSFNILVKI